MQPLCVGLGGGIAPWGASTVLSFLNLYLAAELQNWQKSNKKYHKSSPYNSCALYQVFRSCIYDLCEEKGKM